MEQLGTYIKAGFACINIVTHEEDRAIALVNRMAKEELATKKKPGGYLVRNWSVTSGLDYELRWKIGNNADETESNRRRAESEKERSSDPMEFIRHLTDNDKVPTKCIVILRDFHMWFRQVNPKLVRMLKESIAVCRNSNRHLIIIGASIKWPVELEKDILCMDLPLPSKAELTEVAKAIAKSAKMELNGDTEKIINSITGLTTNEAADAISFSIKSSKNIDPDILMKIKCDTIKKNGVVEVVPSESFADINKVGGLSAVKAWLRKRIKAFSPEAREFGVALPKGLLCIGISGAGKSLIAKTTAGLLGVPMLRLDGGSIYGQLVGDSEKNMRNALAVADAMSPCVLFVDEIEKAMSGLQSSGKCDGGTSSRVIGTFLQWMQDKKSMVFVVATANDVSQLPPEILRRGRFDQIFFVDLPDKEERDEIWKIHIKNTGRKVKDFDVGRLSELTDKFTGAEIESIVADGLLNAFDAGTEPTTDIFAEAVKEVVPLSSTMGERIQAMRKWATNRAISASGKPIVV